MGTKKKSFYPFLFAIYPLLGLYALLPGGLKIVSLFRPILILLGMTFLLRWLYKIKLKEIERANLLTAFTILFFSSTGYVYRNVPDYFGAETHLFILFLGTGLILTFFHPLMWEKHLTLSRLRSLAVYLNLLSVLLLIYPLFTIGDSLFYAIKTRGMNSEKVFGREVLENSTGNLPDIYYIIPDGYTRSDALQDIYNYDNSAFIEALEARNFYVAEQSRSNYVWTMLSLTSSLNMNYLDVVAEKIGTESAYSLPLYELNQQNKVRSLLEEVGYHTAVVSTDYPYTDWQDAEHYFYPYATNPSEIERFYLSMTFIGAFFDAEFSFTENLRDFLPLPSYSTRRDRVFYSFDVMPELIAVESPKFVFVHIVAPHPPFVVDKAGNSLAAKRPYSPTDGLGTSATIAAYQHDYIQQLQFVNREILKAIDLILADKNTPKVILLQSDHGGGSLLSASAEKSCLYERTSILNAYYFPDGNTAQLYPTITPVNSFRIILNGYLGAEIPLLPDKIYFSTINHPFNFIDITKSIEENCDISQ